MPFSSKPCIHLPAGDRLLSVIETKFLHLLNIMKLAPYSVDYVSLRYPEMCFCSKHNMQFAQHLFISERSLCASSMLTCVLDVRQRQGSGSFVACSVTSAENTHGGYWQVHSPHNQVPSNGVRGVQDAQGALGWGEGVECRMFKGSWDGEKGWGVRCSRILIWEGGASCLGGVFHGKRGVLGWSEGLPWEERGVGCSRPSKEEGGAGCSGWTTSQARVTDSKWGLESANCSVQAKSDS